MDKIEQLPEPAFISTVIQLTKSGLLLIDDAGGICDANDLILNDLGYEKAGIKKRTIFEINPHISLIEWKKKWNRLISEKQIEEETELITASGVLFPVKTALYLVEDEAHPRCVYLTKNLLESSRHRDLLKLTAEIAGIGGWEFDLVKKRFFLSQEAMSILGLSKKEKRFALPAFLLWLRKHLKPKAVKRILKISRNAVEQGQPFEIDVRQRGKTQTFQIHGIPQVSEGITAKLFGTIQISTIQGEEKSGSHFILEHAIEMIALGGNKGKLTQVNQALSRQTGYSKMELSGMRVTDLFQDISEEDWSRKWQKLRREQSLEFEGLLKNKSGKTFPVFSLFRYVQYHDEAYFVVFMRNLSIKKKREELLDLMHHTLNQSNDMILWLAEDDSIIYSNDTFGEKLGYNREELNARVFSQIFPEYSMDYFWEKLVAEKYVEGEAVITRKDGHQLAVETVKTLLEFKNRKIACINFRDISAIKTKERALEKAMNRIELLKEKLQREKKYLREELSDSFNFDHIISQSPNYKKVLQQVAQVATTNATVLLLGETGTGKELLARAIHNLSPREDNNLIKVNCAALPAQLIESEIFGHEKGAFTGAHQRKIGRFELADQGTIFLDEIGELPLELQAKLLRVLQEGTFERLGSNETLKVDVRVIAATNQKLEQLVAEGKFRSDLYYRLNVFPIHNLPLRKRKEDIPLLVQFFVKKNCEKAGRPMLKIPQGPVNRLMNYPFPGNVRELENIIERAVILSQGSILNLETVISHLSNPKKKSIKGFLSFEDMQRKHIIHALEQTNWKVTGKLSASQLLRMNGKTLASKMRKLGIKREDNLKAWTEH